MPAASCRMWILRVIIAGCFELHLGVIKPLRRVFWDSILEGRFLLFACHLFIFAIVEPINAIEICLN